MNYKILAINPGSTSTKIAIYENEKEILVKVLEHSLEEIEKYNKVAEQFEMRKEVVLSFLKENGYDVNNLDAVVGRGGMLTSVKSGAYKVNETMIKTLIEHPYQQHASNLGAMIAFEIANSVGIPAYIYDSVRIDELKPIARISGMAEIPRTSTCHALNSRAMAMKVAKKHNRKYSELDFIVAHMGGGTSLSVHEKGIMVDIMSDDEGPFSPERAGRVQAKELIKFCYSGKYNKEEMLKKFLQNSGLKSHLNTNDAREVEKMISEGNEYAKIVYESMAYQVAKGIGELATVVDGNVDYIILTGGIAYSKMFTNWIVKRVNFIAPVEIMPGENEMESLALGTLRVLTGEEKAKEYTE